MARASQPTTQHSSRNKRRNNRAPVLAGVICFGLVLIAAALLLNRTPSNPIATPKAQQQIAQQPSAVSGEQSSVSHQAETNTVAKSETPASAAAAIPVASAPITDAAASTGPAQAVDTFAASREHVAQQLAAGEFGPAIDTAMSLSDQAERSTLLKMVAEAQSNAGEHKSAAKTVRRIPIDDVRNAAHARQAEKETLAGGSGADYDQLIELITTLTSGPWESQGGDGAPDPLPYDNGVRVDPNGLLYQLAKVDHSQRLKALGIRARQADINADVAQKSTLRLVSLTRLEKELARRMSEGEPIIETMKHLAGLSQIQHVFVYPGERGNRHRRTGRRLAVQ